MLLHLRDERIRLRHWILFFICVAFYIGFNAIIIYLAFMKQQTAFMNFNKYALSGIIAQGQVVTIILLTLNPLNNGRKMALVLCGLTCSASLLTVIIKGSTDALPGIVVPLTSGTMSIIISNYSKRLKNQLSRVLDYSRIVKTNEQMLHSLAYYDALTGLPNKKALMDQTEMLQKKGERFYLVYINVDDLKKITDTLGRNTCDAVLQSVAQRWKQYCRNEDLLARVGFSEFVVLVCREVDAEQLRCYLRGFCEALSEPICFGHKEFCMTAHFGVAEYPDNGFSAEELLNNADNALIKAKKPGESIYQFFNKTLQEEVLRRKRLENDLLVAARNNELFVVYQPQYDCESFKLRGVEALMRWEHPELGMISPNEFIPIAEEAGMIREIGKWIIEAAITTLVKLRDSAKTTIVVSVNISLKQLLDPQFVSAVCGILKRTGFESRYLEFEITESALASKPEYVTGVIKQLNHLGIGITLDNFGTKYVPLSIFQTMPIHTIKLDKRLIDRIYPSDSLTGAMISLSHTLGMKVAAQGVEQRRQMDYLKAQQCDYIQGYLLSRPVAEVQAAEVYYAGEQ